MPKNLDHRDLLTFLLREHRLGRVRFRRRDMETTCPACERDRKFSIDVFSGRYACFTCNVSGNMYRTLAEHRARWRVVRDALSSRPGAASPDTSAAPGAGSRGIAVAHWTLDGGVWPPSPLSPASRPAPGNFQLAHAYCLRRGMTPAQIALYKVAILPFHPRVYFNYWNERLEVTYWMGRSTTPTVEPKTLEPGTDKPLFGLHVLNRSIAGHVVPLVEGVFDHFATPNSLATMGSFLSQRQATELASLNPAWVPIVYDADALDKALRAASLLWALGVPAAAVRWMNNTADPGDLGWPRMSAVVEELERRDPPGRCCVIDVRV